MAGQNFSGLLSQIGTAEGASAVIVVDQLFNVGGAQAQIVGGHYAPLTEAQATGLFAGTSVLRSLSGGGTGTGGTSYLASESQMGTNTAGTLGEASTVSVTQFVTAAGAGGSASQTVSTAVVTVNQNHGIAP